MTSLYQSIGGLVLPVEADDVTDTFAPLDPGRDILLDLFATALNSELQAPFTVVAAGTPLSGRSVVQTKWPWRPRSAVSKCTAADYPLLCVYRDGEARWEAYRIDHDRLTQRWAVDYILGPLDVADERKLCDILTAVPKVLALVLRKRGHPDYRSGELQFFEGRGGFASIAMIEHSIGQAQFAGGGIDDSPLYWAVSTTLETTEVDGENSELYPELAGASLTLGVGGENDSLPGVVSADTAIPVQDPSVLNAKGSD